MIEHFNLKARGPRVLLLLVLGGIALLFFLPSSSTDRAEKWRAEMRAKGEKLTAAELISDLVLETNDCMDILTAAAPALSSFSAASVRSTLPMPTNIPPGQRRVAWTEPVCAGARGDTFDWEAIGEFIAEQKNSYASVERALENTENVPPWTPSLTNMAGIPGGTINLTKRTIAQALADAVTYELHTGNLPGALQHLLALIHLAKLHDKDLVFVTHLLRIAIEGLSIDITWQALQAQGWSDAQLASLQGEIEKLSFFPEIARALEM